MLQKTGNVVLEIFQENTGSLHRFIKLYDHRGKIHAVLKKLRLPQFQTEICNFVVIGRWKSQLLCQPGSDFLRMGSLRHDGSGAFVCKESALPELPPVLPRDAEAFRCN